MTWTVTLGDYTESATLPDAFPKAGRAVEKGMETARQRAATLERERQDPPPSREPRH